MSREKIRHTDLFFCDPVAAFVRWERRVAKIETSWESCMSCRKAGYVISIVFLATVFSMPQILMFIMNCADALHNRSLNSLIPYVPGISSHVELGSVLGNAVFHNEKLVYNDGIVSAFDDGTFRIIEVDPVTDASKFLKLDLKKWWYHEPWVFGDRIWWIAGNTAFEVIDGVAQPSNFVIPQFGSSQESQFLWKGKPTAIDKFASDPSAPDVSKRLYAVWTFADGQWQQLGNLVTPDIVSSAAATEPINVQLDRIECRQVGDQLHWFLPINGQIYYRKGFELKPIADETVDPDVTKKCEPNSIVGDNSSAKIAEHDLHGWLPILPESSPSNKSIQFRSLFIKGQPAVFIFEKEKATCPIGRIVWLNEGDWQEFTSYSFPLGTHDFRAYVGHDGEQSYLYSTTSIGLPYLWAVDLNGVRPIKGGSHLRVSWIWISAGIFAATVGAFFVMGLILGLGVWLLMYWYTNPEYGFGIQTVQLASLGQRALARMIDLIAIFGSTLGLGWLLTSGMDWNLLNEALNLKIEHPVIHTAERAMIVSGIWLVAITLTFLICQAKWGVTLGKWLCRLRTVRTSLRPCGFARSIVREIVFCVDCCHGMCWTPGILCIAFTDSRQRLGDFVADTIVIRSKSMVSVISTNSEMEDDEEISTD